MTSRPSAKHRRFDGSRTAPPTASVAGIGRWSATRGVGLSAHRYVERLGIGVRRGYEAQSLIQPQCRIVAPDRQPRRGPICIRDIEPAFEQMAAHACALPLRKHRDIDTMARVGGPVDDDMASGSRSISRIRRIAAGNSRRWLRSCNSACCSSIGGGSRSASGEQRMNRSRRNARSAEVSLRTE